MIITTTNTINTDSFTLDDVIEILKDSFDGNPDVIYERIKVDGKTYISIEIDGKMI